MLDLLNSCKKCCRISEYLFDLKKKYKDYYNKPVKGSGSIDSTICIVGLAPGLHGANKTGKVFTGDFSGDILNSCLRSIGFKDPTSKDFPCITNAVKCCPPDNKPKYYEIKNCLGYLKSEILSMKKLKVIIALGKISHLSILKSFDMASSKYVFEHGKIHDLLNDVILIDSYHCSKLNINTKRVTRKMIKDILFRAKNVN